MRELGLGISNKDFDSFSEKAPSRLSGKILIKVEDNGKAFYVNPIDLRMHYLGKPEDAFKIMRELGLGISDTDLREINVSEKDLDLIVRQLPDLYDLESSKIEIKDLITGVVKIDCFTGESGGHVKGSGFLMKEYNSVSKKDNYIVITNQHVVESLVYNECRATVINNDNLSLGTYVFGLYLRWKYNNDSDVTFSNIDKKFVEEVMNSTDINKLNYKISEIPKCSNRMDVSTKVFAVGYPIFGESEVSFFNNQGTTYSRIITEGIISGYDDSVKKPFGNLPYSNYFISAILDSGSSGGPVFSEENGDLCLLGISTWVSVGNYATQGVVQNIHNIYFESKE